MIYNMKILYVELPEGKQDGLAMTYSEKVDGLNEDAIEMVEALNEIINLLIANENP